MLPTAGDVDIAAESTRLAKYSVLVQASASMLAQANSSTERLMLLVSFTNDASRT